MPETIEARRKLGSEWCITRDEEGALRLRPIERDPTGADYVNDTEVEPADDTGAQLGEDEWQAILWTLLVAWGGKP